MNVLQHRANEAMAKIDSARTPHEKCEARQAAIAVHADLAKHVGDENALDAFRKAKPQSMIGAYQANTVRDYPVFMTGPAETRITGPVKLPDGTMAAPNPQGQIVVPASMVSAMMARGYFRANSVITAVGENYPTRERTSPNDI